MTEPGKNNPFPIHQEDMRPVRSATGVDTWVEDVYGDGAWVPTDAAVGAEFIGLAAKRRRIIIFFAVIAVLIACLWSRTAYLVAHGGSFRARSESNRIRMIIAPAVRGIFYDRFGKRLVDNVPDLRLAVVPADLPVDEAGRRAAIAAVSKLADIDPASAEAALEGYGPGGWQPVTVAEQISRDQAVDLTVA